MMRKTRNHPEIPLIWFVLLRLFVAYRDDYPYCIALNTHMANTIGMDNETIKRYLDDTRTAPIDERLHLLLTKAIKSIYDSHRFTQEDFEVLYAAGWSDKTIYEAIDYATWFAGIARKLNTYRTKEAKI
jgi:hypothetical protein